MAISVYIFDTGVDVPEVGNLVFFEQVPIEDEALAYGRLRHATVTGLVRPG